MMAAYMVGSTMPVLMPCTIRPASSTGKPVATVHTKAPTRKQVSANSTSVLALIHLSMKPTHGSTTPMASI